MPVIQCPYCHQDYVSGEFHPTDWNIAECPGCARWVDYAWIEEQVGAAVAKQTVMTTQERDDAAALLEGIERSQAGGWLDGDRRLRIIAAYKELSALRADRKGLTHMATWPSKSIQARIDLGPAGGSLVCAECPIPKPPNPTAAVYAGFPRDCVRGVQDVWERETWDRCERPHLCPHFVGASRNGDTVVVGCSYPYSAVCTRVLDREKLVKLIGWTPNAPGSQGEGRKRAVMRVIDVSPVPSFDNAAWEDVTVISGGMRDPAPEALRVSWLEQGVDPGDVDILKRHATANVILTVRRLFHLDNQTVRRYCLTERAVQDVQRAHDAPEGE